MDTVVKFIIPGILFVLTLVSGVWLTHAGKPLNPAVLTIHKLIALAAVIVAAVQTYALLKSAGVQALLITLLIAAGVCVVALFVTGALLSPGKPVSAFLLTIHQIAPSLVVIFMALAVCLLAGKAVAS